MLRLSEDNRLYIRATSLVAYSISGTIHSNSGILTQGETESTQFLLSGPCDIDLITVTNSGASSTVTFFLNGIQLEHEIYTGILETNYTLTFNESGWTIYDSLGNPLVSVDTGSLATSALQTAGNSSLTTIAGAVLGTEMQVDIVSIPPITIAGAEEDPHATKLASQDTLEEISEKLDNLSFLALSMDKAERAPIYTEEITGATKKDIQGAVFSPDASEPIFVRNQAGSANWNRPIDTTGYDSIVVHCTILTSVAATAQTSNDGLNWVTINGYNTSSTLPSTSIGSTGIFVYPATGKYFRLNQSSIGNLSCVIYLRKQNAHSLITSSGVDSVNIGYIGSSAVVSAGISGTLGVGGNASVGVAQTANPLVVGGIDARNLTRRIRTDADGRQSISAIDQTNTDRGLQSLSPASNVNNISVLAVNEMSRSDGQSTVDLLSHILTELKVLTHQLKELPMYLNAGLNFTDEPAEIRNFNNYN